jgi:hypothetical protein
MAARRLKLLEFALVGAVVLAGAALRASWLDSTPFWVDEAESSINALTILQSGVPVDHYLGLPIYENTLIKPWPQSPEYEFKDSSYSDKGVAVYHGWLPLYSIATSFALQAVTPDKPRELFPLRSDVAEWKRRTRAARWPSVVFGALFLALCYTGGKILYGRDAGVTALLAGCVHQAHIDYCIRARYYSATVTFSVLAVIALYLIATQGKRKHYVLGALAFVLLFFTHLVTFAAGACVCVFLAVAIRRQPDFGRNAALFCGIIAAAAIPWVFATGFLSNLGSIPPARQFLSLPADLLVFPLSRIIYAVSFTVFAALLLAAWRVRSMPERLRVPLLDARKTFGLLSIWILCGYAAFLFLIPAASFFVERLNLSYWGPALLLGAVSCGAIARMATRRASAVVAPAIAFAALALTGHTLGVPSPTGSLTWEGLAAVASDLDSSELKPDTRLYASPNDHLVLTVYTGAPFQSIAPVRRTFLNHYPGNVIYAEHTAFLPEPPGRETAILQRIAFSAPQAPASDSAEGLSAWLRTRDYRAAVIRNITGEEDSLEPVPPYTAAALARARAAQNSAREKCPETPMFRGFDLADPTDWRTVFFNRFVHPETRMGPNLNYAPRLRGATADLLASSGWVVYRSGPSRTFSEPGVKFRILP